MAKVQKTGTRRRAFCLLVKLRVSDEEAERPGKDPAHNLESLSRADGLHKLNNLSVLRVFMEKVSENAAAQPFLSDEHVDPHPSGTF